jgi:hypothetical protein
MNVRKFAIADATLERSPGQDADVFVGNLIDQRHGGPITIGYGRYGPNQSIDETLAVDDVMVVLEGRLSVSTNAGTLTAGPGDRLHAQGRVRHHHRARARGAHRLCHLSALAGGARLSRRAFSL